MGSVAAASGGPELDPTTYGSPKPVQFDARSEYDQDLTWYLDNQFGFYDGRFTRLQRSTARASRTSPP